MTITADVLQRLAKFDTPTICNVIELFEFRPYNSGYMDARIQAAFPDMPPAVGFAATAAFRSDAPPVSGGVYGSLQDQLEQFTQLPGPAIVVFQDLDDPPVAATFGEVMCSTYQAFGAQALITSGAGRDLEQVRELQFPVFTGSTICSHGYSHTLQIGAPARVGGIMIETGELLHADANGVTTVPEEIAAEVADIAPEFMAAEEITIGYNKAAGAKSIAEFTARNRATKEAIAALRVRVSRAQ